MEQFSENDLAKEFNLDAVSTSKLIEESIKCGLIVRVNDQGILAGATKENNFSLPLRLGHTYQDVPFYINLNETKSLNIFGNYKNSTHFTFLTKLIETIDNYPNTKITYIGITKEGNFKGYASKDSYNAYRKEIIKYLFADLALQYHSNPEIQNSQMQDISATIRGRISLIKERELSIREEIDNSSDSIINNEHEQFLNSLVLALKNCEEVIQQLESVVYNVNKFDISNSGHRVYLIDSSLILLYEDDLLNQFYWDTIFTLLEFSNINLFFISKTSKLNYETEEFRLLRDYCDCNLALGVNIDENKFKNIFGADNDFVSVEDDKSALIQKNDEIIKVRLADFYFQKGTEAVSKTFNEMFEFAPQLAWMLDCMIPLSVDSYTKLGGYIPNDKYESMLHCYNLLRYLFNEICFEQGVDYTNGSPKMNLEFTKEQKISLLSKFRQAIQDSFPLGTLKDFYLEKCGDLYATYIYEIKKNFNKNQFSNNYIQEIRVYDLFNSKSLSYKLNKNNKVSIIFGENGTGKTTIFNFVERLLNPASFNFRAWYEFFYTTPFKKIEIIFTDEIIVVEKNETLEFKFIKSDETENICSILLAMDPNAEEKQNIIESYHFYSNFVSQYFKVNRKTNDIINFIKTNRNENAYDFYQALLNSSLKSRSDKDSLKKWLTQKYNKFEKESVDTKILNSLENICTRGCQLIKESKESLFVSNDSKRKLFEVIENNYCTPIFKKLIKEVGELKTLDEYSNSLFDDYVNYLYRYATKIDLYKNIFASYYEGDNRKEIIFTDSFEMKIKETNTANIINFYNLSSGEKNIITILYELIFNAEDGMIILVDEPEVSLHLRWQESFSYVVNQIVSEKQIQILIASHSPFICSGDDSLLMPCIYISEN